MLDTDLARLYGVRTKELDRVVYRNRERFPEDFAFSLTPDESHSLRCQIGTLETYRVQILTRTSPVSVFQGADFRAAVSLSGSGAGRAVRKTLSDR
jgi:hypothetical protein